MSLRRDAVDFLRRPLLRQINFTLGSMTLRGIRYARIANAIDDGRVEVERSRDVHASAEYDYADWYDDRDRLHRGTLRFQPTFRFTRGEPSPRQLLRHALVVHECTHALQDMRRQAMDRIEAECVAYTSQALYCQLHETSMTEAVAEARARAGIEPDKHTRWKDELNLAADEAAASVLDAPVSRGVSDAFVTRLREAIIASPVYAGVAGQACHFDGF